MPRDNYNVEVRSREDIFERKAYIQVLVNGRLIESKTINMRDEAALKAFNVHEWYQGVLMRKC
jgi:hypothetical protein